MNKSDAPDLVRYNVNRAVSVIEQFLTDYEKKLLDNPYNLESEIDKLPDIKYSWYWVKTQLEKL
jgi:hypothetical protein